MAPSRVATTLLVLSSAFACSRAEPPARTASAPSPVSSRAPNASASVLPAEMATAAPAPSASAAPSDSASVVASAAPAKPHRIVIGRGTKVALIGDSMVQAGLAYWFEKRVVAVGASFIHDGWASSTLETWDTSMRLANMLFSQRPDVVFVVIGTNQIHWREPHMAEHVRAITARIGDRPCVWIGPPVWDYQAGIVDAIRDNAGHCAFVDSTNLTIKRQKDGIHPSLEGGKAWTDAIFAATVEP